MTCLDPCLLGKYRKSSIKSPESLFITNPFEGALNRDGGLFERGGGGLLNLEKTMVSVLHKKPRIQSGNV